MASDTEMVVYKPGDLVTFTVMNYRGPGIVKRHRNPGSTMKYVALGESIEVVPVGYPNWTPLSLQQGEVKLLQRASGDQLSE